MKPPFLRTLVSGPRGVGRPWAAYRVTRALRFGASRRSHREGPVLPARAMASSLRLAVMLLVAGAAWLVVPASAWALPQKICPRIEMDLEDSGNGETYWNSSTVWAEAEAAGMRVRVRTFRVTSTGACDWNTLVADKLGYLDANGCSASIETGSSVKGCYSVELRSYGDPDLSVGPTGTCSTTDPGCNLFVWNAGGVLETSTAFVSGPLYPDGDSHYTHPGAPESVQAYVTMAYAYRKWGRAIGASQGDVFVDDKAKINVFLTGDEHTCGCTGSSALARTCLVPQVAGAMTHHANICIPDVASFRGPDKKFVLTHQWGHVALYLPGALAGSPLPLVRDCSYPSQGGVDQSHHLESREWAGCALAEGFAHFVAADVFNDHAANAGGVFTYWEPCGDQAGGVGDRRVRLESGGFDAQCVERYLDTKLAAGASSAGQGSELDWLRFFWDYHTDAPGVGPGTRPASHHDLVQAFALAPFAGTSTQASFSAFRGGIGLQAGCEQAKYRFTTLAAANGVAHCATDPCPDLSCASRSTADSGKFRRAPVEVTWSGIPSGSIGTALRNQTTLQATLRSIYPTQVTVRGHVELVGETTGHRTLDAVFGSCLVLGPGATRPASIDLSTLGVQLLDLKQPAMLRFVMEVFDSQGRHVSRAFSPTLYVHRERLNPAGTDVALLAYGHNALFERFMGGRLALWRANLLSTFTTPPNPATVRFEDLPWTDDPNAPYVTFGGARVIVEPPPSP